MALAGEGARSDAIDERRRRGSVTTLFGCLPRHRGLSTPQGQSAFEDGALWPMCGCGMAFVYRPISRPMHISDFTSLVSRPPYKLYLSGRRLYRALPARGAGRSALYWYGARTAPYQTHGANMGPFILGPALVASCGSPHNRMPRVPLAIPVASYLSRLAPNCFSRLGPAPRPAAPRGRAPTATRM